MLLGGEPGAGKSRLAREFAAAAAEEGAVVLYGECDAVVHTPYGPFVQALERLVRTRSGRAANRAGSGGRADPTAPELGSAAGQISAAGRASIRTPSATACTRGHGSARAGRAGATGAARAGGRALGRRADAGAAASPRPAPWVGRVLVFASFRDTEGEMPELLAQTLADLRRSDDVVRMRLGRLSTTR